jgi:hypothetical protein
MDVPLARGAERLFEILLRSPKLFSMRHIGIVVRGKVILGRENDKVERKLLPMAKGE